MPPRSQERGRIGTSVGDAPIRNTLAYCHVRTMIKKHPDLQPLKRNFAAKLMYCWPARFAK
eukprot:6306-Pelagococcus_subviridis.AAC.1